MPEKEAMSKEKSVNLRLLLVDGSTHDFSFPPSASSSEIAQYVFDNWPVEWNGEVQKPDRPEILRLIYRGRFLKSTTTLEYLSLPVGKTSTLHMVIRERLPNEQQMDMMNSRSKSNSHEDTRCCIIL